MANGNNKRWDNHVAGRDPSLSEEDRQRRHNGQYEGDIFLKNQDTPKSTAIAIRDSSISVHSGEGKIGMLVKGTGTIVNQGRMVFKASGKNIVKGDFTENPQSSKLFTYTETIELEGGIKEKIYEAAGQLGIDSSEVLGTDGSVSLMTNIGGYPPHNHTMMFKHVHAVEPAYLYRMPAVGLLKGILEKLQQAVGAGV